MRKTYQMFLALVAMMLLGATTARAQERISLKEVPFSSYEGWGIDAKVIGAAECAWVINEESDLPYGDGGVNNRADLSQYSKLIIAYTGNKPRVLLNRDQEGGTASGTESESHLIDNTNAGCMTWASKYFVADTVENVVIITVDLALMVQDKGFAHLHAIKNNWGAPNLVIGSITLVSTKTVVTPLDNKLVWAIGDGT
jgi:hypothetical protein